MSVYNGFSTRQQEMAYSKALYNTIFLLQLRIFKLFKGEKFDDIKFGKVLTKLYARLYSCEDHKYMPPKYSFALKDLAVFLGIFEVSEDDLKQQRKNQSETSSNLSYVTSSGFNPVQGRGLDVIREDQEQKDDEEEEEDGDRARGKDHLVSGIQVGEKAKSGVKRVVDKFRGGGTRNDHQLDNIQKDSHVMATSDAVLTNQNARASKNKALERVPPSRRLEPIELKKRASINGSQPYGNQGRNDGVKPATREGVKKSASNSSLGSKQRKPGSSQQVSTQLPQTGQARSTRHQNTQKAAAGERINIRAAEQRHRSIGDAKGDVKKKLYRRKARKEDEAVSQRDKSDSNASHNSNFSTQSRAGRLKRNETNNSSRGSQWSQNSSIARRKNFTSVGMHRAQLKRPKIPNPPKIVELTKQNLRKQFSDSADLTAKHEQQKRVREPTEPQRSSTNHAVIIGANSTANDGYEIRARSEHPTGTLMAPHDNISNVNSSILDQSELHLNGGFFDVQSNGGSVPPQRLHHGKNAYSNNHEESSPDVSPLNTALVQQRNSLPGGNSLQSQSMNESARLSMSSQKGPNYKNATRTTEKDSSNIRQRQFREVRPIQQFSIAHLNTRDGRGKLANPKSLGQQQRGSFQYGGNSTGAGGRSFDAGADLDSSHLVSNAGGNDDSIVNQSLEPDAQAPYFNLATYPEDHEVNENVQFANQDAAGAGGVDIADEQVEVRAAKIDRKRASDFGAAAPEMRQSAGFPQSTLETITTAQQSKSQSNAQNRQRRMQTGELILGKNKQNDGRNSRELKPITTKKLATANMDSIYAPKVNNKPKDLSLNASLNNSSLEASTYSHNTSQQRKKYLPVLDPQHTQGAQSGSRKIPGTSHEATSHNFESIMAAQNAIYNRPFVDDQQQQQLFDSQEQMLRKIRKQSNASGISATHRTRDNSNLIGIAAYVNSESPVPRGPLPPNQGRKFFNRSNNAHTQQQQQQQPYDK